MKALLVIDMQNDFLPGGALAVSNGHEILEKINAIMPNFDLVVASQDWHPPKHKSFASSHPGRQPFEKIHWQNSEQVLWPDHCVQGTKGAEFSPLLRTEPIEMIIRKGTDPMIDSYSAFFDNQHLKSTGLDGFLKNRNIQSVYVCGLAADYCVYYSAIDAIHLGYRTFYLEDCTRAIDPENFIRCKEDVDYRGGKVINLAEIGHEY